MVAIGGHVLVSPSTTTGVFLRSGDRAVGLSAEHHRYDAGGVEIGADRFHRGSPEKWLVLDSGIDARLTTWLPTPVGVRSSI